MNGGQDLVWGLSFPGERGQHESSFSSLFQINDVLTLLYNLVVPRTIVYAYC